MKLSLRLKKLSGSNLVHQYTWILAWKYSSFLLTSIVFEGIAPGNSKSSYVGKHAISKYPVVEHIVV
jgi:hypothetical protein